MLRGLSGFEDFAFFRFKGVLLMGVTIKVGSEIVTPILAGMSCKSSDPSKVTAVVKGKTLVLSGIAPGVANVSLYLAPDLWITLTVTCVS